MKLNEFGVGRITAQNTTKDVKPGETQRQAAKLGFKLDSEGRPPELHKKARKNSDPNTLFNLGLTESQQQLLIIEDGWFDFYKQAKREYGEIDPFLRQFGYDPNKKSGHGSVEDFITKNLHNVNPSLAKQAMNAPAVVAKYYAKKYGISKDDVGKLLALRKQFKSDYPKAADMIGQGNITGAWKQLKSESIAEAYNDIDSAQMEKWIRTYADRHGVDPDIAVKVWKSEGGMDYQSNIKKGNQQKYKGKEDSWGPFQLYRGGGLGNAWEKTYNKDLRTANDPVSIQQQIDFALQNAAKSGWGQWYGAAKVGIGNKDGIPKKPLSKTYRPIEIIDGPTDSQIQKHIANKKPQPSTLDQIGSKLNKAWTAAKPTLTKAADVASDVAVDVGKDIAKGATDVAKNISKGNVNKDSWVYKNLVKPLTQDVNELKIEKPDPKDTFGLKRKDMPQIKDEDYQEFLNFMKDNGVTFKKDMISARQVKAMQSEFSDVGVIKQLEKNIKQGINKKPVIISSDNYIIDGHHRWLVAMNTGTDLSVYRLNKPARELYALVNKFDKVYYKDIYNETKGGISVPLKSGTLVHIFPYRPLKIKKSTPGKLNYSEDFAGFLKTLRSSTSDDITLDDYKALKALLKARAEQRRKEHERKKDLKTSNKEFTVEGYLLKLENTDDQLILHVKNTKTNERMEVRGKPNYEIDYDPKDKLHQLLDIIGKASNISELMNGEVVNVNPKHPDGPKSYRALDNAMNEDEEQVEEGINDPHIFKAVFLAGGPGSGKSFVARNILGGTGLKTLNSDDVYEILMKKQDLALDPKTIASPQGQEIRNKAKYLTKRRSDNWIDGRLGLLIDGTGKDVAKYQKQAEFLRMLGYDVAMIYVNTSEEVAQQRNQQRARSLPRELVSIMWNSVQQNLMKFQQLMGAGRFHIIDNSGGLEDLDRQKNFDKVYNEMQRFLNTPPSKRAALAWIQQQKAQNDATQRSERKQRNQSVDGGTTNVN